MLVIGSLIDVPQEDEQADDPVTGPVEVIDQVKVMPDTAPGAIVIPGDAPLQIATGDGDAMPVATGFTVTAGVMGTP